jgi:hypothetical protein
LRIAIIGGWDKWMVINDVKKYEGTDNALYSYLDFEFAADAVDVVLLTNDNGNLARAPNPLYGVGIIYSFNITDLCKKLKERRQK